MDTSGKMGRREGAERSKHLKSQRRSSWITFTTVVALLLLLAVLLRPGFHVAGAPMDEGALLVYPEQMAKGKLPYRDFETFYSPGNLWILQGVYRVFGDTITTERAVGLSYRIALAGALFLLTRRWGLLLATFATLLSILAMVSAKNLIAIAWIAGAALALLSFSIWALRSTEGEPSKRNLWVSFVSGLLAGAALLFRLDLAPAVLAAAAVLLLRMKWAERNLYITGVIVALIPLFALGYFCGFRQLADNLFIVPVLRQSAGRRLPLGGEIFPYLILCMCAAALGVVVSAFLLRRQTIVARPDLLLAVSLFVFGICPQALQRADEWHVTLFASVALGWCVVPAALIFHAFSSNYVRKLGATVVFIAILTLVLTTRLRVYKNLAEFGQATFHSQFEAVAIVRVRSREFPVAPGLDPAAIERICGRILRWGKPGQRLFVGPRDLRRTNYNDTFLYYLLPDFEPASYFLEMNPLSANRPNSRLSSDIATADWAILDALWDPLKEPNASRQAGSDEPLRVLENHFAIEALDGNYILCRRVAD